MSARSGYEIARFSRLTIIGFLSLLLFLAPPKPAHAIGCDACAVTALGIMSGDVTTAIAASATAITAGITAETATLTALLTATFNIPSGPGVNPLTPLGSLDYDLISGFNMLHNDLQVHTTQGVPMGSQSIIDQHKYMAGVQGTAEEGAKAVVPDNSVHCATTYGMQAREQMSAPTRAITEMITAMVGRDRNAGQGSDSGVGLAAQLVCESASFRVTPAGGTNPRNGQLATQFFNCKDSAGNAPVAAPAQFADADLSPGSVFDPMMYTAPAKAQENTTSNGHIEFVGLGTATPVDLSKWAFVAAWRFCEHLVPPAPAPPNTSAAGVALTLNDLQREVGDMSGSAVRGAAVQLCMHAIAYRTACPNATAAEISPTTATVPANCFQIQAAACHRLKDPSDTSASANPSGLGITDVGNEEANTALANCDNNGISQMMVDYIWAHRCGDRNFMSKVVPQKVGGDTAKVEQEEMGCRRDVASFEAARRDEKRNYLLALELLLESPSSTGSQEVNPLLKQTF